MNQYTEGTIKNKSGLILYYLYIEHFMFIGFEVFSNPENLKTAKEEALKSLEKYAPLYFSKNLTPPNGLYKAYQEAEKGLFTKIENRQIFINYTKGA